MKELLENLEQNLNNFVEIRCKDEQFQLYEAMIDQVNTLKNKLI